MHSLLALAACHWRYHYKSPQQRCYSEIFHAMQACSGLRVSLDTPRANEIDAAVTTSMFLGSVSFADTSEVFQIPLRNRPIPFLWLGNQLGLGSLATLVKSTAKTQSIWLGVFEEAAEAVLYLDDSRSGTDRIPAGLSVIFGVDDKSTCNNHRYFHVLRRLCRLLQIDPDDNSAFLQHMQLVDGMSPQFVRLLNTLDTRALMLLSYWLALLCAKDCWWSLVRAKNDCWAICEHLEQQGDELLWKYMDFPAEACGYPYDGSAPAGRVLVDRLRLGAQ